ncbi:MAG: TetR/AcrR family transcriptional regulator [Kurthia sp.]|nr:TetR/AcrR family transcriptional regulator [Candidatus Kurthia equi]
MPTSKERMMEAILQLLHSKPLQTMPVKEIAQQAGVSRATFYIHFPDKQTLMMEVRHQVYEEFLACYRGTNAQHALDIPFRICRHIMRYRSLYQMVFADAHEMKQLAELLTTYFQKIFQDEDYAIFVSYGTMGYLSHWVKGGFLVSPVEAAEKLMKIGYTDWNQAIQKTSEIAFGTATQ